MGICPPCSSAEMLEKVLEMVCGKHRGRPIGIKNGESIKIKGTVVLMKKNVLDMNDVGASLLDRVHELFNKGVSIQLISADRTDPAKYISVSAGDVKFDIDFEWDESMGVPGAFMIRNYHHSQFYLKTVTLDDVAGHGNPLPINTPETLRPYREEELINLRGNGSGMLKEWDRVYDYAYYNDLGNPDGGPEHARPVLGGVKQYPYLSRINTTTTKTYASRTVLLLQDDGTLKPLAIELSLPHPQGDKHGATSEVFTPAEHCIEGSVWQLAKAYVAVEHSCSDEPFIIATNRHLSVLHPIFKLLQPHFRDTMNINALARHTLINAGGILELTVFPSKYALEMSAAIYKDWVFPEQALPADLLKRGMAVADSSKPHGLRLLIEDYPYAVDGLEIWSAIEEWVEGYCSFYYHTDGTVQGDSELQSWWTELGNVGHGDLKDEPRWPQMQTRDELVQACTIIIWVASALHGAVNFGQYPYAGYLPNRPTVSRRFMPEPGTPEYAELESNPDLAFLKTITAQFQTLLGVSLIEILSRHSSDEIYLGQRDNPEWTSDGAPQDAFKRFGAKLVEIENQIIERNNDKKLKNRTGPVKMPYTLLIPNASDYSKVGGLICKGIPIPNSISI